MLRLARFPGWNEGSEILSEEASFAGDGPVVAGIASGLGLRAALETNRVGTDEAGVEILAFLARCGIAHQIEPSAAARTPKALILTHPDEAREWLVNLEDAAGDLAAIAGDLVRRASLVYVDCFASIEAGACRAIALAAAAGRRIYANLGAGRLPDALADSLVLHQVECVQASLPETEHADAIPLAHELLEKFSARAAYVTLGSLGAVAVEDSLVVAAPARRVDVDFTHCAGAAFAGGVIYARSCGWPLERGLAFACALASMQCTTVRHEAPSEQDVTAFIGVTSPGQAPSVAGVAGQAP